ncbi:hypothetical protein [Lentilactobacillus kosonis]|uniref:Uncharacterized protein n=1 Tax=Lentilactobacillus kosonis TaxID=2810561 RepID=A0A401FPE1_9LACO|nr:hypothetical protein [Lentilactobacillus kosonis]GAY74259.1 hypothetical protein NBRC111893_2405 [Lentilactobacillus kosonis]
MKKAKYSNDKFVKKFNHDQRKKEQQYKNELTEKKYDATEIILSINGHDVAHYVGNENWARIDEK